MVQSTSAYAFITVKDVPDINPQFLNLPNFIGVEENSDVVSGVSFFFIIINFEMLYFSTCASQCKNQC